MSSIESLKEKARAHEQREEWAKALELYDQAISKLEEQDQPDIGLYNRVGDLKTRLEEFDEAAEAYETAVDLYMESELPNNAIAVCKKIIRNMPERHTVYLRMGQIRAEQGFLVDARVNFLTYAERVQAAGDMDEAFRALTEFADLAPEDLEVRMMVGSQLVQAEREEEAVEQLSLGYRQAMAAGRSDMASAFEEKLAELDPSLDLASLASAGAPESAYQAVDEEPAFAEFEMAGGEEDAEAEAEAEEEAAWEAEDFGFDIAAGEEGEEELPGFGEEGEEELPGFGEEEEEEAEPLPTFGEDEDEEEVGFGLELEAGEEGFGEDEEEEAEPLPTFGDGEEEEAEPLPTFGDDEDEEEAEPLPTFGDEEDGELAAFGAEESEDAASVSDEGEAEAEEEPVLDAMAFGESDRGERMRDGYVESEEMEEVEVGGIDLAPVGEEEGEGGAVSEAGAEEAVEAAVEDAAFEERVEEPLPDEAADEAPAAEEYVDFGGLVLDDEGEKTTRFKVAHEEPTGDEQADFAKMLSQFKRKIAENVGADDVRAHHDLGTAYKEMGLLDEAIEEFQAALRASAHHLPTYELLGQVFLEKGQPTAAVRSLTRALEAPYEVEDELVGIYYYLGRAHEAMGNTDSAREFYDRVFSLDINFADVTERLRNLRS